MVVIICLILEHLDNLELSFTRNLLKDSTQSGASTETVGKREIVDFGLMLPSVSVRAPVFIPKESLALGAYTEYSWVSAKTSLI